METRRHKNFIMIKNKMWEAFYNKPLPEQERRVFDYIFRMTIGWGCEMKELSTYIIAKDLEIDDRCVRRIIGALKDKKRIIVKGKSKGIQKDFTLWTIGQIRPIKTIGQIRPTTRTNKSVSLGQIRPLIKDTLKDKKKETFLSKTKETRIVGEVPPELKAIQEKMGRSMKKKKEEYSLNSRNQNKEK